MSYQKLVFSNAELMVFRDAINCDRTVSKLVEKFDNAIWSECGICNRFHYTISFEKSEFYVMKDLMAHRDDAVGQVWLEVVVCNSIKYHNYRPVEELSPEDKVGYEQYCELVRKYYNNSEKLHTVAEYFKYKESLKQTQAKYAEEQRKKAEEESRQKWEQWQREYDQRKKEQEERAKAEEEREAEQRRRRRWQQEDEEEEEEEYDARKEWEEAKKRWEEAEQRTKAGRKKAANDKRRTTRERKRREREEYERQGDERRRQKYKQRRKRSSPVQEALKILELSADILKLAYHQKVAAIKEAWRKIVLKVHPDRGGTDAKFREVNEAYEYLMAQVKNG